MMKKLFYFMLVALGAVLFTACSDDDDKNELSESVNPSQVFVNGMPQRVGGMVVNTTSDGLVSEITDGNVSAIFTYLCLTRSTTSDVVINIDDKDENDKYVVNLSLNSSGYAKYWKMSWMDGDSEERWFDYNAEGQLLRIKISNSESSGTVVYSYENGNIIKARMTPADGGDMFFSYGNTPNNGCIMLFEIFGIEDKAIQYAYYAGLLGKATTSLPIKSESYFDGEKFVDTYAWTINGDGLPTKLVTTMTSTESSYSDTEEITFEW